MKMNPSESAALGSHGSPDQNAPSLYEEPLESTSPDPVSSGPSDPHSKPTKVQASPVTESLPKNAVAGHDSLHQVDHEHSALPSDVRHRQALERNQRLRSELKTVVEAAEEVFARQKSRQRNQNRTNLEKSQPPTPAVAPQDREVHTLSLRVSQAQSKVARLTSELETAFALREVKEKEDLLKDLKRVNQALLTEKSVTDHTISVYGGHEKASESLRKGGEGTTEPKSLEAVLTQKVADLKTKFQELVQAKAEREKEIASVHSQLLANKSLLNELMKRVEDSKRLAFGDTQAAKGAEEEATAEVSRLEQQITTETKRTSELTAETQEQLRHLEKTRRDTQQQVDTLLKSIRDKEKENQTAELKLRELKKFHRHTLLKPMPRTPAGDHSTR